MKRIEFNVGELVTGTPDSRDYYSATTPDMIGLVTDTGTDNENFDNDLIRVKIISHTTESYEIGNSYWVRENSLTSIIKFKIVKNKL